MKKSTYFHDRINRGLGQTITSRATSTDGGYALASLVGAGSLTLLRNKILAPEAKGGLTDTMQDRTVIGQTLMRLIDALGEAGLEDEVAFIYVDFRRGDPTQFASAQVLGIENKNSESKILDLFVLGTVKKAAFGGYRFTTPRNRVLTQIHDRQQMAAQLTAEMNVGAKALSFEQTKRDLGLT